MLLKITESCSMGCTHCLNDAKPNGKDMSLDVLEDVLSFIGKTNTWGSLIITGGEPTEHKNFVEVISRVIKFLNNIKVWKSVVIATNGFWVIENQSEAKKIVAMGNEYTNVLFQVSTDRRYYPKRLDITKRILRENGFVLCDNCVEWVYPQGRAKLNSMPTNYTASSCFNIRAVSKQVSRKDLCFVESMLASKGKICTPAIRIDGSIGLGESDLCPSCSSVYKSSEEVVQDIINFKCNGCFPLNENLPIEYKKFIE